MSYFFYCTGIFGSALANEDPVKRNLDGNRCLKYKPTCIVLIIISHSRLCVHFSNCKH